MKPPPDWNRLAERCAVLVEAEERRVGVMTSAARNVLDEHARLMQRFARETFVDAELEASAVVTLLGPRGKLAVEEGRRSILAGGMEWGERRKGIISAAAILMMALDRAEGSVLS